MPANGLRVKVPQNRKATKADSGEQVVILAVKKVAILKGLLSLTLPNVFVVV